MKTGIIADIHLDTNKDYPVLDTLCDVLYKENCTGLILAGDISDTAYTTFEWLDRISNKLEMPLMFVPGNHDMWDPDKKFKNAWQIYEEYKQQEGCLCGKAIDLGNQKMVTGSIGWYDYSLGSSHYTEEEFNKKTHAGRVWQDSRFVRWGEDDKTVCKEMLLEMEHVFETNKDKNITAVTHMISIPECSVIPPKINWDYFNAFLGSRIYGEAYEKYGVSCGIMGHVHYRKRLKKGNVEYKCACLGYHTEWTTKDVEKEIKDSLQFLE